MNHAVLNPILTFSLFIVLPDAMGETFSRIDYTSLEEVNGLIIPRDNEGMYIRNDVGQFEVVWTPATRIAPLTNTRQFNSGLSADRLDYGIHSSKEIVTFPIHDGADHRHQDDEGRHTSGYRPQGSQ